MALQLLRDFGGETLDRLVIEGFRQWQVVVMFLTVNFEFLSRDIACILVLNFQLFNNTWVGYSRSDSLAKA